MTTILRLVLGVLAVLLGLSTLAFGAERQRGPSRRVSFSPPRDTTAADSLERSRAELRAAVRAYHTALERVLSLQENDLGQASDELEKARDLYSQGLVASSDVEEAERRLTTAREKVDETRRELTQSETFVSDALPGDTAAQGAMPSEEAITLPWSVTEIGKVEHFFAARFGHSLPISALGQSAVHDRMGFDHHNAVDVALYPDSEEGQALIAYLRRQGVPFLAFRGPVRGAATGAHIHIGEESKRIAVHLPTRVKRAAKHGSRARFTTTASVKRRIGG